MNHGAESRAYIQNFAAMNLSFLRTPNKNGLVTQAVELLVRNGSDDPNYLAAAGLAEVSLAFVYLISMTFIGSASGMLTNMVNVRVPSLL